MPKISIIVPVYKVELYLRKCVESVLIQTFTDFECILIDDGSTDNCPAMCDEYAKKDKRIIVIHQKNMGVTEARKAGIEKANGEWLFFLDADDMLPENSLYILLNKAIEGNYDIVIGDIQLITSNGKKIKNIHNGQFYGDDVQATIKAILDYKCSGSLGGKIIKKKLVNNVVYPSAKIKIGEDQICIIQLIAASHSIGMLNEYVYYYVQHHDSTMNSNNPKKVYSMLFYLDWIKKYIGINFPEIKQDCMSFILRQYIIYLLKGGKWKKRHGMLNLFFQLNKNGIAIYYRCFFYCYALHAIIGNMFVFFARILFKIKNNINNEK